MVGMDSRLGSFDARLVVREEGERIERRFSRRAGFIHLLSSRARGVLASAGGAGPRVRKPAGGA